MFSALLLGELVLSEFIYNLRYLPIGINSVDEINIAMIYLKNVIAILWWIIPAYYITSAFEHLLWRPIEIRTEAKIPNVLRLFIIVIVYALAGLGILSFVLEVTMTSLAATSGVIAIVFALASKIDLSNIIAGLGISFAKTIHINDWVKINDVTGKVVEMTPRATKLLTVNSSLIIIPNTAVASAVIENYNRP
jgi:small-conductance mechanosensitive channel